MVRTAVSVRVSSGVPKKINSSAGPTQNASEKGGGGGNPVCPRETPNWQKPITMFLIKRPNENLDKNNTHDKCKASTSNDVTDFEMINSEITETEVVMEGPSSYETLNNNSENNESEINPPKKRKLEHYRNFEDCERKKLKK